MLKPLELHFGFTNRYLNHVCKPRNKTVPKCVGNLHGECFCPDLCETHLSCQAFLMQGCKCGLVRYPRPDAVTPPIPPFSNVHCKSIVHVIKCKNQELIKDSSNLQGM